MMQLEKSMATSPSNKPLKDLAQSMEINQDNVVQVITRIKNQVNKLKPVSFVSVWPIQKVTMGIHAGLQHRADTNHLYRGNQVRKLTLKYDKKKNVYRAAPRKRRATS